MELPPLPDDSAPRANQINNRGQAVGVRFRADGRSLEPVVWDNSRPLSLGLPPGGVSGEAFDINDRGGIVGGSRLNDPWIGEQRSFIWRNRVISDLLPLPRESHSVAWGINNRGQVVGQAFATVDGRTCDLAGRKHGVVWSTHPQRDTR